MKWKTRDGYEVEIRDMDDGHLINIIRFLVTSNDRLHYSRWRKGQRDLASTVTEWLDSEADFKLPDPTNVHPDLQNHMESGGSSDIALSFLFMQKEAERRELKYMLTDEQRFSQIINYFGRREAGFYHEY